MTGAARADDGWRSIAATLIERLPAGVMVTINGNLVAANAAAVEIVGVDDLAALRARTAANDHVHPDDRPLLAEWMAASAQGTAMPFVELRIVRPDGSVRIASWSTVRVPAADGDVQLCSFSDITHAVDSRNSLAASEAFQRQVFEALTEGVVVFDADGICIDANRSAAPMLGLPSAEQLVGAPLSSLPDVVGDASCERRDHPVRRALADGEHCEDVVVSLTDGDQIRHLRGAVSPLEEFGADRPVGAVLTLDDVTSQVIAAEELRQSEGRFRNLANISPVGIFETDVNGDVTYVNSTWSELFGLDAEQGVQRGWESAIHPDDRDRIGRQWSHALTTGVPMRTELRVLRPSGHVVNLLAAAAPIRDDAGTITGWIGTTTDLTYEYRLREQLRAEIAKFHDLAERSPDIVLSIAFDPPGIQYVNKTFERLTGVSPAEVYENPRLLMDRVHPDDLVVLQRHLMSREPRPASSVRVRSVSGEYRHLEARTTPVRDAEGKVVAAESTLRDVTDAVEIRQRLDDLAHRDPLTGLLNRRALTLAVNDRLTRGRATAVLFCDLDGFKAVNDTFGHEAGDALLVHIAEQLREHVRDGDVLARFAGDEFVVAVDPPHAEPLAQRLLDLLAQPITLAADRTAQIGISIGIAHFADRQVSVEELIRAADAAMYKAKRAGKHQAVLG